MRQRLRERLVERYRVLISGDTGRGDYGHGIDTVWQHIPECEVVAVCDPDPAGRARAIERLGVTKSYDDFVMALDQERPDIVAIGSRWIDRHAERIMAAAERGIHLFVEKPLCRTPAEADQIVAACQASGSKLAIAHQSRYSPVVAQVKSLLQQGAIGELLEVRARGKEDARGGAEDLWVLGSHLMNLIHHLAGEATWVQAKMAVNDRDVLASDQYDGNEGLGKLGGDRLNAMFGLSSGVVAHFGSRRGAAGGRFGLQLMGSQGVIELLTGFLPAAAILSEPTWSVSRSGTAWRKISSAGIDQPETIIDETAHGGNIAAVHDLLAAIRDDRHPECNMYEGRMTIEMICGVFAAHRAAAQVALPLVNREHPWANWS